MNPFYKWGVWTLKPSSNPKLISEEVRETDPRTEITWTYTWIHKPCLEDIRWGSCSFSHERNSLVVFQLPVRGASAGDGLRGVRSEDQPRHDPVVFSEAGVGCKSLNLKILPALFLDASVLSWDFHPLASLCIWRGTPVKVCGALDECLNSYILCNNRIYGSSGSFVFITIVQAAPTSHSLSAATRWLTNPVTSPPL